MNYQLFSTVFKNKLLRQDIFDYVDYIHYLDINEGVSIKWVDVINNIAVLIKYNYVKEFKECVQRYIDSRSGDVVGYSYYFYETIRLCLRYSRLEMLQSLVNHLGVSLDKHMKYSISIKEAAFSGRKDILEFIINHYTNNNTNDNSKPEDYINAFIFSPTNANDLHIINYLYNKVKEIIEQQDKIKEKDDYKANEEEENYICRFYENTAMKGKIFIVQWLLDYNLRLTSINEYQRVFQKALENGHLDYLNWFKLQIEQIDPTINLNQIEIDIDQLVLNRQIDSLNWAQKHMKRFKCKNKGMDYAYRRNDLELIKWLHFNQSGSFCTIYNEYISCCNIETIEWWHNNRTESFTSKAMDNLCYSSLEKVKWFHEHRTDGCTNSAMENASTCGNLDIIMWLHQNTTQGCTIKAIDRAAQFNKMKVIQWLHENRTEGCTYAAIDNAAANSNFELISWLAENTTSGCSEKAPAYAIINNNRELFFYLMEKVIPLTQPPTILPVIEEAKLKFQSYGNNSCIIDTDNNNNNSKNEEDKIKSQEQMFEYFIKVVRNGNFQRVLEGFESKTLEIANERGCLPYVDGMEKLVFNRYDDYYKLFIATLYNHKHLVKYYLKEKKYIDVSIALSNAIEDFKIDIADLIVNYSFSRHKTIEFGDKEYVADYQKKEQYLENHNYFLFCDYN